MQRIIITLRPRNNFLVVYRIRIHADYDLRPSSIAIIPSRIAFADTWCSAVTGIPMHRGMHRWKRYTKANVLRNRVITQLIEEIGAPVPLQTRRIEGIEHTLYRRMGNRSYKIKRRLLECPDWFECFFRFLLRSNVRPDYAAHFFHVQMFGEWRSWWDSEKGEEAIQIIRSPWNQLAIPFHDVCCFAQFVEHRSTIEYIDRMQFECKRSYDPKVPAAAAKCPEQIGVLISIRFHKFSVRQNHIGGEQIVDGQSAFAGEMPDPPTEG